MSLNLKEAATKIAKSLVYGDPVRGDKREKEYNKAGNVLGPVIVRTLPKIPGLENGPKAVVEPVRFGL